MLSRSLLQSNSLYVCQMQLVIVIFLAFLRSQELVPSETIFTLSDSDFTILTLITLSCTRCQSFEIFVHVTHPKTSWLK